MQLQRFFITTFFLSALSVLAQGPVLKPFIGISSLPNDADAVCTIPMFPDPIYQNNNFDATGIQEGDTIADFTLYTLSGTAVNIKNELQNGKPILLVAGSYTCPIYRNKMVDLNNIASAYANDIEIFIIYVVEAHPKSPDISPYSGTVWETPENQTAGILYAQPTTYSERKNLVTTMLANMTITPTILIDGPCNNWWNYFGPAPNNAYLITADGIVFSKHGWFNQAPNNMANDIDSLLALISGTGEKSLSAGTRVTVYPNPFTSSATFSLTHHTGTYSVEVYDVMGRKVEELRNISANVFTLQRKNLSSGMYFYRVSDDSQTLAQGKFILN